MTGEPQALPGDGWPLPDALTDLSDLAAATVAEVERYLDQSPLQRYVADLSRRVAALEAARARHDEDNR